MDPKNADETNNKSDLPQVKLFEAMVSLGLGYGQPWGTFYSDFESGLVYFVDVRLALSSLAYSKFTYRNQSLFDGKISIFDTEYGEYLGEAEISFTARQYLVAVGFLTPTFSNLLIQFYGEFGGGGFLIPITKSVGLDCGFSMLFKIESEGYREGNGVLFNGYLGGTVSFGGGA